MLHLPCKTPEAFEKNLSRFITTETKHHQRKITYIDCQNTLSQYLFSREDLAPILKNLFVTRIDRAYDLLELFKNIGRNPTVQQSHYVLVSPFYHLLEGFPLNEEKNWFRMWENSIERLEKTLPIHVVVMGE
jgi:hypothetical protein